MTDISKKITEAEKYLSQGMPESALELYEAILEIIPANDLETQRSIEDKIAYVKSEIEKSEKYDTQTFSSKELELLQSGMTGKEGAPAILDSASAFRELGMFKEAIAEYEKLFKVNYPPVKFIPDIAECLLEIESPSKTLERIDRLLVDKKFSKLDKMKIKEKIDEAMKRRKEELELKNAERIEKEKDSTAYKGLKLERSYDSKYAYLLENKIVTTGQLQNALAISKKTNKSVEMVLIEQLKVKREDIAQSLQLFYKCPFKFFEKDMPIPFELISKQKKEYLLKNLFVPMGIRDGKIDLLIDNPKDLIRIDHAKFSFGTQHFVFSLGIKEDIEEIINYFFKAQKPAVHEEDLMPSWSKPISQVTFEDEEKEEEKSQQQERQDSEEEEVDPSSRKVVQFVDDLFISAYERKASDIHIEPSDINKRTGIRFRIDGVCETILEIPNSVATSVLSRIKIMAGLDIAEKRLPQDGKIKFKGKRHKGKIKEFELRLATIPTAGGQEDAVLRILAKSGAMSIDEMGINERNLRVFKKCVTQPYGLILVVGPTGSGKTTTLHAALGYINKPGIKIWTAEDPVEITQAGLRQVECKPKIGLDFARIMRAFLRADPDVIMIGEMRDEETASIGVEASLTGHQVYSTLHTNSAPETITRLLDMGLNPLNFSDAFLCVLAQRLARRICKNCKQEFTPTKQQFDDVVELYGKQSFESTGISRPEDIKLYQPVGCEMCSNGYKGRLGVHELMEGSPEMKRLIKNARPTEELFELAAKQGMTTIRQDGIIKAFSGLTDISEIKRVCIS
ncbi:MAG: Flp pilus assembly complex ATPase component TadA [Desulfobacterales bacterium]|nr:Flp pilus assembly complex ATPase component TadA [Desulfobacterales bacterium]